MNKKGGGFTIAQLLWGVVAIFILVVLAIFIYMFITGKAIPFIGYFNQDRPPVEPSTSIELLRYNPQTLTVEYTDGANWFPIIKEKIRGNKKLIKSEIEQNFKSFWFNLAKREPLPLEKTLSKPTTKYNTPYIIEDFSKEHEGSVLIRHYYNTKSDPNAIPQYVPSYFRLKGDNTLWKRTPTNNRYGIPEVVVGALYESKRMVSNEVKKHMKIIEGREFTSTLPQPLKNPDRIYNLGESYFLIIIIEEPNDLYYRLCHGANNIDCEFTDIQLHAKVEKGVITWRFEAVNEAEAKYEEITNLDNSEKEIKQKTIEWRDSVLTKPISITYTDTQTDKPTSIKVCAEINKPYLVVDLSNPTTKDTCP